MTKTALIIFAREPKEGRVKTRLAADIGPSTAVALYKAFINDIVEVALKVKCSRRFIYFDSGGGEVTFIDAFKDRFKIRPQTGNNLGLRMHHAFEEVRRDGFTRSIIIGTDCLTLAAKDIDTAFEKLKSHDCVLGPTKDGGYYLIGLRHSSAKIFSGIPWGTSRVLEKTIRATGALKKITFLLKEKMDVDTAEDLKELARRIKGTPKAAHTQAALREIL